MAKREISQKTGMRMVLLGLCGLLLMMDLSLRMHSHEHGHGPAWMDFPGFFLVLGLAGAALLVIVAKLILFPLLKREESYYEETGS